MWLDIDIKSSLKNQLWSYDTTLWTFLKANTQVLSKSRSSPNGFNRSSGVLSYLDPDMDPWSSDCYSLASFLQQIRCCTIKVYNVLTILTSSRAKFSNMFLIISIKFTVLKPHYQLCHSVSQRIELISAQQLELTRVPLTSQRQLPILSRKHCYTILGKVKETVRLWKIK